MLGMNISWTVIDVKVTCFFFQMFKCYNILTCTIASEYSSSNEICKKNGTVRGECIARDILFHINYLLVSNVVKILMLGKL